MTQKLTSKQTEELQVDLLELKLSLEQLLESTDMGAQPVKLKDNAGRLSRMDEMHNQSILIANRNLTKRRLKQIDVALRNIDNGIYGFCLECDESIALTRLKAYPEADMCINCKSLNE